jgi:hypothetical protein
MNLPDSRTNVASRDTNVAGQNTNVNRTTNVNASRAAYLRLTND